MTLALVLVAGVARAEARPADVAAARELAKDGMRLAGAKDWAGCIDRLTRAESLFHAPTILERLGECQVAVGKLVAGTENLRKVAREELGAKPPPAFVAAQQRARKALDEAEPRLGHLTVTVKGPSSSSVAVTLDGEALPSALLGVAVPSDPGKHVVRASAPGFMPREDGVEVAERGEHRVELELAPEPPPAAPVATKAPEPPPQEPVKLAPATVVAPPPPPSRVPVVTALGVGGAGLVVGGVFGALALGNKASLDKVCVNKACPLSARADIGALQTNALVSSIGWAAGVVGAGAALVFALTAGSSPPADRPVSLLVGPGAAAISVRF